MSDVEALLTRGDHERGCEGRTYTCTCGYDERMETALRTLSEQLAEAREVIRQHRDHGVALAIKAGTLNCALDGQEQFRTMREGVLVAMKSYSAFLAKTEPSDAG